MLNIDPYTILFTLINLLILFVAMKKVLFKPINDILESRAKTVQDNLEQAQRQREEAQALKAQYEEQMAQSRQQTHGSPKRLDGRQRRRFERTLASLLGIRDKIRRVHISMGQK